MSCTYYACKWISVINSHLLYCFLSDSTTTTTTTTKPLSPKQVGVVKQSFLSDYMCNISFQHIEPQIFGRIAAITYHVKWLLLLFHLPKFDECQCLYGLSQHMSTYKLWQMNFFMGYLKKLIHIALSRQTHWIDSY